MKRRILSLALALAMCLTLLPTAAFAAKTDLPDWYFLFAIFKNIDADVKDKEGKITHVKRSMTQDEINFVKEDAKEFEAYMNQVGVMRAHVDVVEVDTTVTQVHEYSGGAYLSAELAAALLKGRVDLDKYDHITCAVSLTVHMNYLGITGSEFENGTGHSCINLVDREYCMGTLRSTESTYPESMYVHEYLHVMERLSSRLGAEFGLHDIRINFYSPDTDGGEGCYTDIILNRARGDAGTGVHPAAWQYPPHVLRTMREWTIPSGVTGIGKYAFQKSVLTKVVIPGTAASIGYGAFLDCPDLAEVVISPGVSDIGPWGFGRCPVLTQVTIPASVTNIGDCAFYKTGLTDVYYGGSEAQWKAIQIGGYNSLLTNAVIHYNSTGPDTAPAKPTQPASPAAAAPTNDKLEVNGQAAAATVYKINGSNYFKIRDVAALLNGTEKQFSVGYDSTLKSATVTTGQGYAKQSGDLTGPASGGSQNALPSGDAIYVDGRKIEAEVYKIGGSNYFKLRDLGEALDFYVGWSRERGMYIETDKPYSE